MKKSDDLRKLMLPQIITSNINERYVDKAFLLLGMITDTRVMNDKMNNFKTSLTDNDDGTRDIELIEKQTVSLNDSYSKLDLLQKKIINRTLETALAINNIDSIRDKYLMEINILIDNYKNEP